ncbi:MAG: hypothetical protein V2A73_04505 [Pseudomonadota bacterium]
MIPFGPAQTEALHSLADIWRDTAFVLIGAAALQCHLPAMRGTADLDITVAASMDAFPSSLLSAGWFRNPRIEYEWCSPGGAKIDLIPAGPAHLQAGFLQWPSSGRRMNLAGLRHAFSHNQSIDLSPAGAAISVADLSVLALLKIVAYLDRPSERRRDLGDLALILEEYLACDDVRRWQDDVIAARIPYDCASSFVLGRNLAAFVDGDEQTAIRTFLGKLRDENDPHASQTRMLHASPPSWSGAIESLLTRLDALERGLEA